GAAFRGGAGRGLLASRREGPAPPGPVVVGRDRRRRSGPADLPAGRRRAPGRRPRRRAVARPGPGARRRRRRRGGRAAAMVRRRMIAALRFRRGGGYRSPPEVVAMGLFDAPAHSTIAVSDIDKAREFYEQTLGFTPDSVGPAGVFYPAGGSTRFFVYPSGEAG